MPHIARRECGIAIVTHHIRLFSGAHQADEYLGIQFKELPVWLNDRPVWLNRFEP
jgi:hypothetical protein